MLAPNAFYRMNYPSEYKGNILLTKFEKDDKPLFQPKMSYTFLNVSLKVLRLFQYQKINNQKFKKVTASFSYTRYIKED